MQSSNEICERTMAATPVSRPTSTPPTTTSTTRPSTSSKPGYVVIGGGIAGVTCVEHLSLLSPDIPITLVTASPLVKAVTNFRQISKVIEHFSVEEKHASNLQSSVRGLSIVHAMVSGIDAAKQVITIDDGESIPYSKLCICSGGQPDIICKDNPNVLGIRDTETVKSFQKKLAAANRVAVIGNGGIATELVYEIQGSTVIWAIRDKSISHTFVDAGAAEFFLPHLKSEKESVAGPSKRMIYAVSDADNIDSTKGSSSGGALGPDWSNGVSMQGGGSGHHPVYVEYECEVQRILTAEEYAQLGQAANILACDTMSQSWPVYILLTNGKLYGCDLIVSATGVNPNVAPFTKGPMPLTIAPDGGISVDDHMRTNLEHVYAAGDVCSASWQPAEQWFQMRLWSQARQMGAYAAKCMIADTSGQVIHQDFCFELFAHMTTFFGFKVVLLGKFNGQGLDKKDYEALVRVTLGVEYIKVILKDGKMYGAILIGDTDLEETFENLILNKTDLTRYGEDLLNPGVDIEDYFD
ncbi:pyridine nucleotide-disulfide oxidoreductase domain-containing protein 1-like [Antedon mediterranea]|uniref:pyridine nucleotide-disulfide oxidoreductase domain-containing protein 1-like n=1 Tax=Antedon mediterranea TaxID=105859 RepID=UPI003AF5A334